MFDNLDLDTILKLLEAMNDPNTGYRFDYDFYYDTEEFIEFFSIYRTESGEEEVYYDYDTAMNRYLALIDPIC